ncbi:SMP-30/gluconolactonase/LRE family protein [Paraburkholderia flava]|uniref:SMP-30/gluconolactonase/LRE family protein n=1 Tax=Paraburkholderia flava TaxID=2547393 RepID=UPI00105B7CE0|nr:SMP-30/gluconolactonase/LRE family protein [Paraburkholderia flava]
MNIEPLSLLADDFAFLEGPRWYRNHLWASDITGMKLYRIAMDGTREVICDVPHRPSGIGFLPDGTPVVVSMTDRRLMRVVDGKLVLHADLSALAPADLNDLVVDDDGRIYVGNFGYDLFGGAPKRPADLFVVEPDGSARVAAGGFDFPNGVVLKDGGRTLVVAESWSNRLTAFDRDDNGNLSNGRLYADMGDGQPDGICVDREGGIWVPNFNTGEVVRILEGGVVTDRISVGNKRALACQLGGEDGRTLFCITFDGPPEDLMTGKRLSALYTTRVAIPGPGCNVA